MSHLSEGGPSAVWQTSVQTNKEKNKKARLAPFRKDNHTLLVLREIQEEEEEEKAKKKNFNSGWTKYVLEIILKAIDASLNVSLNQNIQILLRTQTSDDQSVMYLCFRFQLMHSLCKKQ